MAISDTAAQVRSIQPPNASGRGRGRDSSRVYGKTAALRRYLMFGGVALVALASLAFWLRAAATSPPTMLMCRRRN